MFNIHIPRKCCFLMSRHMSKRLDQLVMWILPRAVPNQLVVKTSRNTVYQRKAKKRMWEKRKGIWERGRKEEKEGSGSVGNKCMFRAHIHLSLELWFHEMIPHTELAHSGILYVAYRTHQYPHVYSTSRKNCHKQSYANCSPLKFSVEFS